MPIVLATKPPSPSKSLQSYLTKISGYENTWPIVFNIPLATKNAAGGWSGGIFTMGMRNPKTGLFVNVCWVTFANFTNNCGMRAIQSLNGQSGVTDNEPLCVYFLEALEEYAVWLNYSALVGSDGLSSGSYSQKFITRYGRGWKVESLGQNRRMGLSGKDLYLFWKYLPAVETYTHSWNNPIA